MGTVAIIAPIADLRPHPRNYRRHPSDQIAHLAQSLREHGPYRNVVATRDGVILAGHGLVEAARSIGLESLPILKLDIAADSARALKILMGDNEIAHLAEIDDRMLTEMLRELNLADDLLGTGFDAQMVAALAMVTRPANEITDFNAAAEWVGMPEYEPTAAPIKLIIQFPSLEEKARCAALLGLSLTAETLSAHWPPAERDDVASVRFIASE